MKIGEYKLIFVVMGLIGVLLIATPALSIVIPIPEGEKFSELSLLGPGHTMENYPFNIAVGHNNSLYVGVTNQLGSSAYYVLYVKLKNQTDLYPNPATGTPSSVSPLYEYAFFLHNGDNWESLMNFSVSSATFSENQALVNVLTINDVAFTINKPAAWDSNSTMFPYQLLFELWIYNAQTNTIQYNNRYVSLQLNLTQTV
ncbi:MAG: DUF1616 domain-containing protein [Candidatus Bathyarchaeia archaeon]